MDSDDKGDDTTEMEEEDNSWNMEAPTGIQAFILAKQAQNQKESQQKHTGFIARATGVTGSSASGKKTRAIGTGTKVSDENSGILAFTDAKTPAQLIAAVHAKLQPQQQDLMISDFKNVISTATATSKALPLALIPTGPQSKASPNALKWSSELDLRKLFVLDVLPELDRHNTLGTDRSSFFESDHYKKLYEQIVQTYGYGLRNITLMPRAQFLGDSHPRAVFVLHPNSAVYPGLFDGFSTGTCVYEIQGSIDVKRDSERYFSEHEVRPVKYDESFFEKVRTDMPSFVKQTVLEYPSYHIGFYTGRVSANPATEKCFLIVHCGMPSVDAKFCDEMLSSQGGNPQRPCCWKNGEFVSEGGAPCSAFEFAQCERIVTIRKQAVAYRKRTAMNVLDNLGLAGIFCHDVPHNSIEVYENERKEERVVFFKGCQDSKSIKNGTVIGLAPKGGYMFVCGVPNSDPTLRKHSIYGGSFENHFANGLPVGCGRVFVKEKVICPPVKSIQDASSTRFGVFVWHKLVQHVSKRRILSKRKQKLRAEIGDLAPAYLSGLYGESTSVPDFVNLNMNARYGTAFLTPRAVLLSNFITQEKRRRRKRQQRSVVYQGSDDHVSSSESSSSEDDNDDDDDGKGAKETVAPPRTVLRTAEADESEPQESRFSALTNGFRDALANFNSLTSKPAPAPTPAPAVEEEDEGDDDDEPLPALVSNGFQPRRQPPVVDSAGLED